MKNSAILVFLFLSLLSVVPDVEAKLPAECKGKLPHYLVGLTKTEDQIEAFKQVNLIYEMSRYDSMISAPQAANLGEQVNLTFYGHTFTLFLSQYRKAGNTVYYYTAAGATELSLQEFECVKADLRNWIQESIDQDYAQHEKLTDLAIKNFAEESGKTVDEVKELQKKVIPEFKTNYGDVLLIPDLKPVDFINSVKHAYFAPMRSCNASVMINTILVFTPCIRRIDYVLPHNEVMKHELVHTNKKLQGYPLSFYVNMELFAALLPYLSHPVNLDTFFNHPYLRTPEELLHVFGGFDVDKVRKEMSRYRLGRTGMALNEDVLRKYIPAINDGSAWIRESALKVFGVFYSDPRLWAAVNEASYDNDMAYKVIMALHYEPTLLDGHANTIKFILQYSEQSARVAERAKEKIGKSAGMTIEEQHRVKELKHFAEVLGFNDELLMKVGKFYGFTSQDLQNVDPEFLRKILYDFVNREGPFQLDQGVTNGR